MTEPNENTTPVVDTDETPDVVDTDESETVESDE